MSVRGSVENLLRPERKKMPFLSNLTAVVLLLVAHCGSWTVASRLGPHKLCPSCKDPLGAGRASRDHLGTSSTAVLALGEPCGVYTLSCAKGLRCMPPPREHSPLQALLQGRGICGRHNKMSPTERPHPPGPHPSHGGETEKAPCRKLLNAVLRGLELTVFPSDRDIYIPNCDTRGYYRKKQCRSSKGMQRGHCWCVDELGLTLQSRTGEDGALPCDGE